jgi:hypothetical protein
MTERSDGVAVADRERRRKLCRPGRRVAMETTIAMHTDAHTPGMSLDTAKAPLEHAGKRIFGALRCHAAATAAA